MFGLLEADTPTYEVYFRYRNKATKINITVEINSVIDKNPNKCIQLIMSEMHQNSCLIKGRE